MKTFLLLIASILFLTGCEKNLPPAPIKIGAVLELTGDKSEIGSSAQKAARMAVNEVNEQGGLKIQGVKVPVQLVEENNDSNISTSIQAVNKLISQDRVLAIIGPNDTSVMPTAGIAERNKVVFIAPSSTEAETTMTTDGWKKYVFRISYSRPMESQLLANFARYTKNYKTAAVLYDGNSQKYTAQANAFKANFEKSGGNLVAFKTYDKNIPKHDFLKTLNAIKQAKPNVLFLADHDYDLAPIAKEARDVGVQVDLLGNSDMSNPKILKLSHGALENAYAIGQYITDDPSVTAQSFKIRYQQLYVDLPDKTAALTYDAYQALFKAISAADVPAHQLTSRILRDSLVKLPAIDGVTGVLDYVKPLGGEPKKSGMMVQIKGNKPQWISYANP